MGGGLLPPVIATAVGARGRLRDRQRRPTRLGRTPIEGAAAEIEPVDRAAIRDRTVVGGGEGRIIGIENRQERSNKL